MDQIRRPTLMRLCSSATASATSNDKLRFGRTARLLAGMDDQLRAGHPVAAPLLRAGLLPRHADARGRCCLWPAAYLPLDRNPAGPVAGSADDDGRFPDQ